MGETHIFQAPIDEEPGNDLQAAADALDAKNTQKTDDKPNVADGKSDERPEWLPPKFKTPQDLAKAYGELEKKFSQRPPKTEPQGNQDEQGLDFIVLVNEAMENEGSLTKETYDKLQKAGVPREFIDYAIKGAIQTVEAEQQQIIEKAGGQEQYDALCKWAESSFNEAELASYNKAVTEGSLQDALLAIDALKARFEAANGKLPNLISGDGNPSSGVGYASRAEMVRDMQDPKYSRDPAYRKMVEDKIKATTIF